MLQFYTAVGRVKIVKQYGLKHPLVILRDKEAELSVEEMMLWSILVGSICTYEEIKICYDKRQNQFQLVLPDFKNVLERLIFRGLVAVGEGNDEDDALFQLFVPFQMVSCRMSFLSCCSIFIKFILIQHMSVGSAVLVFQNVRHKEHEKYILRLLKDNQMRFEEIIQHVGNKYETLKAIEGIAKLYCKGLIYLI